MINMLRFFWSLHNKNDRLWLIYSIFFPLIFSLFLYLFLIIFPTENNSTIFHLIYSYIFIWLLTLTLIIITLFFYYYHCKKNRRFNKNKKVIKETTLDLINERDYGKIKFIEFCYLIIFVIFFFELFLIIHFIKDDPNDLIFAFSLLIILLPLALVKVKNIFTGLQESWFEKNSIFIFLPISSVLFLRAIILRNAEFIKIDYFALSILLPVIGSFIGISIEKIIVHYTTKQKKEQVGFSHYINPITLIMEFILSFIFVFILISIVLAGYLLGLLVVSNFLELIIIALALLIPSFIMLIIIDYAFLSNISHSFIKNIIDWSKFFNCYNGQPIPHLVKSSDNLVKVIGKCRAISLKETYRKKIPDYNQHFILELINSKEEIDVISLEEKNPFFKYKKSIAENDEIMVIGKIKSSFDDENLLHDKISDYILAYHIEPT